MIDLLVVATIIVVVWLLGTLCCAVLEEEPQVKRNLLEIEHIDANGTSVYVVYLNGVFLMSESSIEELQTRLVKWLADNGLTPVTE
jgi:hypothetical protein